MKNVNAKDKYVVKKRSVLTDFDRRVLTELYFPLIGAHAFSLYFKLWSVSEREDNLEPTSHQALLNSTHLSIGFLNEGRCFLEAMGLMTTSYDKNNKIYVYSLYAPKSPKDFFGDIIFGTLLKEKVGDSEYLRIKFAFTSEDFYEDEYEDISSSFGEVFHPDFSSFHPDSKNGNSGLMGRSVLNPKFEFDRELFFEYAIEAGLQNRKFLDETLMDWIEKTANLYGIREESLATIIVRNFEIGSENPLDYDAVIQDIRNSLLFSSNRRNRGEKKSEAHVSRLGSGAAAKKIRVFESVSPYEYLKLLQGGTPVTQSDFDLITRLSNQYGLKPAVINAIIDYSNLKTDGTMPTKYVEKIAASLNRKGINEVLDTMNFLFDINKKSKQTPTGEKKKKADNSDSDSEISQEELEGLLS